MFLCTCHECVLEFSINKQHLLLAFDLVPSILLIYIFSRLKFYLNHLNSPSLVSKLSTFYEGLLRALNPRLRCRKNTHEYIMYLKQVTNTLQVKTSKTAAIHLTIWIISGSFNNIISSLKATSILSHKTSLLTLSALLYNLKILKNSRDCFHYTCTWLISKMSSHTSVKP